MLKPGSVVAVDAKTVKFNLLKTFSPFLATVPAIRIVNSKLVKANAGADDGQTWLATHVASAGPYTLKSWDRGTGMIIDRDPNYYRGWGDGADRRGALRHHERRGDRALDGGVGRIDDVRASISRPTPTTRSRRCRASRS